MGVVAIAAVRKGDGGEAVGARESRMYHSCFHVGTQFMICIQDASKIATGNM